MSSTDNISSNNYFPWIAAFEDLYRSNELMSNLDSSTDDSLQDIDKNNKTIFIGIYDQNKNNMIIISNITEIEQYRKRYLKLPQKHKKHVQNIWDDVIVFNEKIESVPLRKFKQFIDKHLSKTLDETVNNIEISMIKNLSEFHELSTTEKIKRENQKETLRSCNKKIKLNSPIKINNSVSDSILNNHSSPVKNKINNTNSKVKIETTDSQSVKIKIDTEVKSPYVKKIIKDIKSTNNNTEKAGLSETSINTIIKGENVKSNLNDESDTTEFKKPAVINSTIYNNKNVISITKTETEIISKKKLKKQRQKENKLKNAQRHSSKSSSKDRSESSSTSSIIKDKENRSQNKRPVKFNYEAEESYQESDANDITIQMNTSDDDTNLLSDLDYVPTFIAEAIKHKEKPNISKTKCNEISKNIDIRDVETSKSDEGDFILHTRKRDNSHSKKADLHNLQENINTSDGFGKSAVNMILNNNIMSALEYLAKALALDPTDHRHYLNRCYCYLRLEDYTLALEDAQYVIGKSTNAEHMFIANLRAGQAACALGDLESGESYLKEATLINPRNQHALRELMRSKIKKIVSIGFKERDALLALRKHHSTLAAINYLTRNKTVNSTTIISEFDIDNYDELVYSSDIDEKPNNIEILNRILNYKPGKTRFSDIVTESSKSSSKAPPLSNKNSISSKKKTSNSRSCRKYNESKCIWVGNLIKKSITESVLRTNFKKFGNIVSIYRPDNEIFAFINFEKSEDIAKVLADSSNIRINGIRLDIRTGVRKK